VRVAYRVPLLVLGFVSLASGVATGLARFGFALKAPATLHGALLAGAFFGTVISLERAVAVARPWAYAAPLGCGLAGVAWILGAPATAGGALLFFGALVLLAASLLVWQRQPALHNAVLAAGAACLALATWLAAKDIARRTVREQGLTRYIAWALLAGYAWLGLGALAALAAAEFAPGRPAWDAALHAWFLGFVFSMVFGHAPIIAPALLRAALPYHSIFYLPLVLLHASVAMRFAGSLLVMPALREAAALGHAVAIALFILTMATRAFAARRPQAAKV
jgi:hypothetical protein